MSKINIARAATYFLNYGWAIFVAAILIYAVFASLTPETSTEPVNKTEVENFIEEKTGRPCDVTDSFDGYRAKCFRNDGEVDNTTFRYVIEYRFEAVNGTVEVQRVYN